jgi:hypothetical protein
VAPVASTADSVPRATSSTVDFGMSNSRILSVSTAPGKDGADGDSALAEIGAERLRETKRRRVCAERIT